MSVEVRRRRDADPDTAVEGRCPLALELVRDTARRFFHCATMPELFTSLDDIVGFLLPEQAFGVFLSQTDPGFDLVHCVPASAADTLRGTGDELIESGQFARQLWNAGGHCSRDAHGLSYTVATPQRIFGLALLLGPPPDDAAVTALEAVLDLLAIVLDRLMPAQAGLPPVPGRNPPAEATFPCDPLTGLVDRATLVRFLRQSLADRRQGEAVASLFINLDRFQQVNREFGHDIADRLLRDLALRVESALKSHFVCQLLGTSEYAVCVARTGGDEFGVGLSRIRTPEHLEQAMAAIHAHLTEGFLVGGTSLYLSTGIGAALCASGAIAAEDLLSQTDTALKRAKGMGRNRHVLYSPECEMPVHSSLRVETLLHEALRKGRFRLRYQPQLRLRDHALIGIEALLRLAPGEPPALSPARFIPVAETSGQIIEIGEWVLAQACRQARSWRTETGLCVPVGINLSAVQLGRADLLERFLDIVAANGGCPEWIQIEITETAVAADEQLAGANVRALREHGFEVWLDDFGTGYSSLVLLERLPLSGVKLDRSFVARLPQDAAVRIITEGVVGMVRGLGLPIIAEGIETPGQHAFLKRLGCDGGQGFHLARPLTAQALTRCYGRRSSDDNV